jgi:hypothetical protein
MGRLNIRVYSGSSSDFIKKMNEGIIKVGVKERPIEGRANEALISFLSTVLRVSKCDISIRAGLKSRNKIVEVEGVLDDELKEKIKLWMEKNER